MQLDPQYYEASSEHYYVPQPSGRECLLYYPVSVGYFDCKPSYGLQRNMFSSYLLLVMLTDVLLEGTQIIYVGDDEIIQQAFGVTPKDNTLFLPGVMSRKKQVIPMLSALWG